MDRILSIIGISWEVISSEGYQAPLQAHWIMIFFFFNFYWCLVALQCCIHFCSTEKCIGYTPPFLDFLPIQFTMECWGELPVLYIRFLLAIYFIYSSAYMSIPISQLIPPPYPLGIHMFILYVCVSISALQISLSVWIIIFVFIRSPGDPQTWYKDWEL